MKKLMKKLEDLMVAVTFAEAGEYDEASQLAEKAFQEDTSNHVLTFEKPAVETAGE